jgi:hypothetical protein
VCDQGTEALASIEQGFQQVEVMKGLEQVELVISTNAFFSVSVAAQAVAKLIPQHPGAHFQINSELPRDAVIRFNEHHKNTTTRHQAPTPFSTRLQIPGAGDKIKTA